MLASAREVRVPKETSLPFRRSSGKLGSSLCAALWALLGCSGGAKPVSIGDSIELRIVAHEDDDLLFMNPDLHESIVAGRTVRTVFLTAGDAGADDAYWNGREEGILEAYASMASATNAWESHALSLSGRQLQLRSLKGLPRISVVFLRLPDGNGHGQGFPARGKESLAKLWEGKMPSLHPVDGSASFSKPELIRLLASLMADFHAQTVDTQDWSRRFRGDHSDHLTGALFAHEAERNYAAPHRARAYRGYNQVSEPLNLLAVQKGSKEKFFLAYARHDERLCKRGSACRAHTDYPSLIGRQYPYLPGTLIGPGGKCLQATEGRGEEHPVVLRTCREVAEQKWSMAGHRLENDHGECLSLDPPDFTAPSQLITQSCDSDAGQRWFLTRDGHMKTADGSCATVALGGEAHGLEVFGSDCGDVPEQKWRLYPR